MQINLCEHCTTINGTQRSFLINLISFPLCIWLPSCPKAIHFHENIFTSSFYFLLNAQREANQKGIKWVGSVPGRVVLLFNVSVWNANAGVAVLKIGGMISIVNNWNNWGTANECVIASWAFKRISACNAAGSKFDFHFRSSYDKERVMNSYKEMKVFSEGE